MKKKFKVVGCNPNKKKGFVWKLVVEQKATAFGIEKNVKRTYYIGGMPAQAKIGQEFVEDLDRFEIVQRPFVTEDGQTLQLKWLHVKAA